MNNIRCASNLCGICLVPGEGELCRRPGTGRFRRREIWLNTLFINEMHRSKNVHAPTRRETVIGKNMKENRLRGVHKRTAKHGAMLPKPFNINEIEGNPEIRKSMIIGQIQLTMAGMFFFATNFNGSVENK